MLRSISILVMILLMAGFTHAAASAGIHVDDFTDGETLRYPVPLLHGTLTDTSLDTIVVTNLSSNRDTRELTGMAEAGKFKALVELVPGVNHLQIKAGDQTADFQLTYKPQTNPRFIRAVLFTDETGDTHFSSPLPNDPQNYRGKFDTILKIMQGYTADWMNRYGYGRKTFNLEFGDDGKVIVHVVKGSKPGDHYRYDLNRQQLYGEVSDEVLKSIPDAQCVDCTLISFSNMDPKLGHSVAYTALGGGKIALFGGACMYAFPDSIADVQKAFTNPTAIDHTKFVADSIQRYTFWATASTSIGAMLHEMGHSMGLPHSDDKRDIMTRGIDNFGRYFVFYDPPSMKNPNVVHFSEDQVGYWSPVSAAALAPALWLDLDRRTAAPPPTPAEDSVALSPDGKELIVSNPRGIGFLGYEKPGAAHSFHPIDPHAPLPTTVRLNAAQAFAAGGETPGHLRIIDGDGHLSTVKLEPFVPANGGAASTQPSELLREQK